MPFHFQGYWFSFYRHPATLLREWCLYQHEVLSILPQTHQIEVSPPEKSQSQEYKLGQIHLLQSPGILPGRAGCVASSILNSFSFVKLDLRSDLFCSRHTRHDAFSNSIAHHHIVSDWVPTTASSNLVHKVLLHNLISYLHDWHGSPLSSSVPH